MRNLPSRLARYLTERLHELSYGLTYIYRAPGQSVVTIIIIGLTLALPLLFIALLHNAEYLIAGLQRSASISVYFEREVSQEYLQEVQKHWSAKKEIQAVHMVTPEQGLVQLQQNVDWANILTDLPENPLPPVLVFEPQDNAMVAALLPELEQLPGVELVQADLAWINYVLDLVGLAEHFVLALAVLLSTTLFFVISHAIYFMVHFHRREITIIQLIGGTDMFIRRPFLNSGLWLGVLGAGLAGLLVSVLIAWLQAPVSKVVAYYSSQFKLQGLTLSYWVGLLVSGAILGYWGAWLAVTRYLRANWVSKS